MKDGEVEVEAEHLPITGWIDGFTGKRYCSRHSVHGAWVHWPCEETEHD